jgi:uracil-DNA glycosylase
MTMTTSPEITHPANDSLRAVTEEVIVCTKCPRLVEWREQVAVEKRAAYRDDAYWGRPVPGFGDPEATLLVVGLAPAAHGGNRTGRIFTGDRSGDWLYRALFKAGYANQATSVSRDDGLELRGAYVTACVRCAPPANKPTPAEKAACLPYLVREMALLNRLKIIVCLGAFAYDSIASLEGLRGKPKFRHGLEVDLPSGRRLICSFHPSQQNTFTGKLTEPMLDAIFLRARELTT